MMPTGYGRAKGSGLLVPHDLAREREVWPREEWKTVERAMMLAFRHGATFVLGCPTCHEPLTRTERADGTTGFHCGHKDHVWRGGR